MKDTNNKTHRYTLLNTWTGNIGAGTAGYRKYDRTYTISIEGKPDLQGTSDPQFLGDRSKYNPEELFLAAISGCHLLWYLHLCAVAGVNVDQYSDQCHGIMKENRDGSGAFSEVTLSPKVIVRDLSTVPLATELHTKAGKMCFIANSCNFPIRCEPDVSAFIK